MQKQSPLVVKTTYNTRQRKPHRYITKNDTIATIKSPVNNNDISNSSVSDKTNDHSHRNNSLIDIIDAKKNEYNYTDIDSIGNQYTTSEQNHLEDGTTFNHYIYNDNHNKTKDDSSLHHNHVEYSEIPEIGS